MSSAGFTVLSEKSEKGDADWSDSFQGGSAMSDIIGPSCAERHPRTCISPFFSTVDSHSTAARTVITAKLSPRNL